MPVARDSRLTLACILVTILLDMIGLGIIVPVLPELIEQLTGSDLAQAAVSTEQGCAEYCCLVYL